MFSAIHWLPPDICFEDRGWTATLIACPSLVHAWKNQGSKSNALSDVIKAVYETAQKFNVNDADAPLRALSQNDCMLAILVWKQLEARWDPQSVDLMSLDSNVERGADGQPLTHFTPWTTKNYSGVNVFAQSLDPRPTCTSPRPPSPFDSGWT